MQPIPRRPGLITERQSPMLRRKLLHQLDRRRLAVFDRAEIPNFAVPATFRNRHRIAQLRCIDTDKDLAIIRHDSSSLREALPGHPGNPRLRIEGESPQFEKDIRSALMRATILLMQEKFEKYPEAERPGNPVHPL